MCNEGESVGESEMVRGDFGDIRNSVIISFNKVSDLLMDVPPLLTSTVLYFLLQQRARLSNVVVRA